VSVIAINPESSTDEEEATPVDPGATPEGTVEPREPEAATADQPTAEEEQGD